MKLPTSAPNAARSYPRKPPSSVRTVARSFPMKPLASARSAERSSRTRRRRPTRNRHNLLPMKNNQPVVDPKVPLVGLKVLPAGQADLLVSLRDLPVDQAGPPEGAEDDGPGKAWIEPRTAQRQRKSEHSEEKSEHSEEKREHRKDNRRQLVGRRIRHGWRVYIIVDPRRTQQSAARPLVHRDARLERDIGYSPLHAVVLDGAPRTVVGEGAVLQRDAATVGKQVRV